MSRRGRVLPTPDDPHLREVIGEWPWFQRAFRFPRSAWLREVEDVLREHYPAASSRDLNVTARSLAPFTLAERDW